VLLTLGPKFGPAILCWGVLVVILMVSLLLGKIPITPLKSRHWFLLLIGLSQLPTAAAGVVVAWLLVLGIRKTKPAREPGYFNSLQVCIGLLTLAALLLLFAAIQQGLLGSPEMQITGNDSSPYQLNWYQDRSPAKLPEATVVSVPLMAYRILMLAWSLWLASALLSWLKWGWQCFSHQGLWQSRPPETEGKASKT
ncbi:MAG: hypothetical protein ACU84J_07310, partial [Gammaproteobacteria bacterium]